MSQLPFVTEDSLDAKIAQIEQCKCDYDKIMDEIGKLKTSLANLITGVIVQGTYNPMYGTFALPVGVNSNVLVAYYGNYNGSAPLGFPTDDATHYLFKSQVLTDADWNMIGNDTYEQFVIRGGETMISEAPDNAGTIYVTVNPNTVDFSGEKLTLVNSQDEESGVKLSALKASDKVLTFGYTKATNNGFYEANAHLDAADVPKVKINIEPGLKTAIKEAFSATKGVVSTAYNRKGREALKDTIVGSVPKLVTLAAKLYSQFNGILPAEAVKASYVDGEGATHSVYSNYGVAATAIKPLSFAFGKDFDYKTVPGYEKAIKLVDKIDKKLKDEVHVVFKEVNGQPIVKDIQSLKIHAIEMKDLSPELKAKFSVAIDTIIKIEGLEYHLDLNETVNVPVKFTQDVTIPINIDKDIEVDLSQANISTPTVVITTSLTTGEGEAVLVVPVTDNFGTTIGNAKVPLDDVNVEANAEVGEITVDGTVVAHIEMSENQTVSITVDQTVPATIKMDKWLYFGDNGTSTKSLHLWVTKDFSDAVDELWDVVKEQIEGVNDMLDQMNKLVDDANDLIDKFNEYEQRIDDRIDDYANRLKNYIDKVNSLAVRGINSLNNYIQPVMIVNADKLRLVSMIKSQATFVKDNAVTLHPTTYTAEIITPCLKKHLAVTNVYKTGTELSAKGGDATCLSALRAANQGENMNKVLNGGLKTKVTLSGLKEGYTYEIAYSALDYSGNIVTRRYFISH